MLFAENIAREDIWKIKALAICIRTVKTNMSFTCPQNYFTQNITHVPFLTHFCV